jgi:hypothetical protein
MQERSDQGIFKHYNLQIAFHAITIVDLCLLANLNILVGRWSEVGIYPKQLPTGLTTSKSWSTSYLRVEGGGALQIHLTS